MVHCHIAKQPMPPKTINPAIPVVVSDLVMRLLAKVAEDRYQSAWGIQADLQRCLQQLQTHGKVAAFPLAEHDRSDRFQIPQKLYGREADVKTLLTAYERIANGSCELILVSGHAGIGKSALVQELYRPMTQQRGYLIAGKFDPFHRDKPYTSLIAAFRDLIRQLLSETAEEITRWREHLLLALGDNGQIIIDAIPEVQLILGEQPAVPDLPPTAAENRFNLALQNFVRVFTQPDHPLVIFLDDVQWADLASLKLIQRLITAPDRQYLMVIGAYRDNEVTASHPLMTTLNQVQQAGVSSHAITLSALQIAHVNQLIADTVNCELAEALPLAELLMQKTDGNPFLSNELLKSLYQEEYLNFDPQQGRWLWDLNAIQAAQLTDNVVELMVGKIQKLPSLAQQRLTLAACIGYQFDLGTLAIVSEQSLTEAAADLWDALQAVLIVPIGNDYRLFQSVNLMEHESINGLKQQTSFHSSPAYRFAHDRVRQAAYALISEAQRKPIHLKVGQLLWQATPADGLESNVFDIVNHLNVGLDLILDQTQKHELAALNLLTGQSAQASVAYETAANYLTIGRRLLSATSWSQAYELTLALYVTSTEVAYLCSDFEQMEALAAVVLQQTNAPLDQVTIYQIQMRACITQGRMAEAIAIALKALSLLDVPIPPNPALTDIVEQATQTKRALAGKAVEDLLQLPKMTDPLKLAAMKTIACVCTPTYFTAPHLWQLMVFQKMQLSLQYGNAPGSAFGYADYGMVLCGVEDNLDQGYQFAQLASHLLPQLNAKEFVPKTLLLVNIYLRHWKEHLRETLDPLLDAYQQGLETGDLEYATAAIAFRFYHAYLVGKPLPELDAEMATYAETIRQFNQPRAVNLTSIYHQAILNLMERSAHPCALVGTSYNEIEQLPQHLARNDRSTLFHLYLNKLMLHYWFQDYTQATQAAATATQLLSDGAMGLLVVPIAYFYDALAHLAIFADGSPDEQQQILDKVASNQQKMQHWADHAPMNYQHKFELVEAERYRILGNPLAAMEAYDRAIDLATQHHYRQEAALANELAAKFYLDRGQSKVAPVYLLEAHYTYQQWGAVAKVKDLEQRYPQLLSDRPTRSQSSTLSQVRATSPDTSSSTESAVLDLDTLMKAAQTLASEIVLDQLLANLMKILLENAGAERGYLILETQGKLLIEAERVIHHAATADTPQEQVAVLQSLPLEDAITSHRPLAIKIIHYVVRTHESVVLNHATQDGTFTQDPYIIQYQPKSILCTPLMHQGKLSGILYVENNLTIDAFTPERLEVLQLLSVQAAIALENARLYHQLEQRVQERTAELFRANQQLQENEQQILQALEKERELNLLKSKFVSMVSHEFRNPMTTIGGCAKALQNPNRHLQEAQKETYFKLIQDSITDMLRLLDEVLVLGRTEAGGLQYNPKPMNLKQFCQGLTETLQVNLSEQQTLTLTYQGEDNQVTMDSTLMQHILSNLLSNAIKYSPQGGQIRFDVTCERTMATFQIQDQGIGIPSKDQERLFETFHRSSNVGEIQGTGLGLAIVKRCVDLHQGQIHLASEMNVGTTVTVMLPVASD